MKLISKYKYEKGLASSMVNDIISDFLHLSQTTNSNPANFHLYKKISSSDYLQQEYFKKTNSNFIEPQAFDKITDIDGRVYDFKFSAIPLKPILLNALENKSIIDHLWQLQNQPIRHEHINISSPHHALINSRIHGKLQIEVYIDDTQYSPGFMNKTQKHTCVYLSLADLPFHNRTKQDSIDVYMLLNEKKFKSLSLKDPFYAIFSRLKSEIEDINLHGGLEVCTSSGQNFELKVTISSILGDNLAIYPLVGYSSCFNNNTFVCRFCSAKGTSEGDDNIQELFVRRRLITNPNETDQLQSFIFDQFDGINRWNICPPDIVSKFAHSTNYLLLIAFVDARPCRRRSAKHFGTNSYQYR